MSLTQALSIALSGLQTSTALITLASNNISNAQTPGYTEKTGYVTSVQNGTDLGGSTISGYNRTVDQALSNNYNDATASSGFYTTQNGYMSQVQSLLDSTDANPTLSNDIAQFSAAWSQYSSAPESSIQQQSVLDAGRNLANDINNVANQIGSLNSQVQSDTSSTVISLNSALQQIATINGDIQDASSTNGPAIANLEDQRDAVVNQISQYLSVNTQPRANGQIALYTPSGQLLVDGGTVVTFSYSGGNITTNAGVNVTSALTGGSLQAETEFTDTSAAGAASTSPGTGVIAKLNAQLSKLVDSLTNSSGSTPSPFATAYTAAVTASTATGATQHGDTVASSFFTVTNDGVTGLPDPSTFAVTASLLAGTSELPQTATIPIANSFNQVATYTTSGLAANSVTYAGLTTAILSSFQQTANTISTAKTTAATQKSYYQTTLASETGVNIDTELTNLITFQNSYAASAHVITTVNQMLTTLEAILP